MHYVEELIFELISQNKNITSLLGGNVFVTFLDTFSFAWKTT